MMARKLRIEELSVVADPWNLKLKPAKLKDVPLDNDFRRKAAPLKELTGAKQDFGFETTLSGRSYVRLLNEMKNDGYRILLFFLWLPSADLAVARVKNRVRQGGHNVPEPVIRRRFESGIRNLFQLYRPRLDAWWLYDASRLPPKVVAEEDGELQLFHSGLFEEIKRSVEA